MSELSVEHVPYKVIENILLNELGDGIKVAVLLNKEELDMLIKALSNRDVEKLIEPKLIYILHGLQQLRNEGFKDA